MAEKKSANVVLETPGVIRCGEYLRGVVYTVDKTIAERLVAVKGFKYADEVKDVTN